MGFGKQKLWEALRPGVAGWKGGEEGFIPCFPVPLPLPGPRERLLDDVGRGCVWRSGLEDGDWIDDQLDPSAVLNGYSHRSHPRPQSAVMFENGTIILVPQGLRAGDRIRTGVGPKKTRDGFLSTRF